MVKRRISWFDLLNGLLMVLVSLMFILPYWFIVSTSLMSQKEFLARGYSLLPLEINLDAYRAVLENKYGLSQAFGDTILVTVVGTVLSLGVTAAMAFGLSKRDMVGRNALTMIVFFTMLFGGGMIPTYMVVKQTGLLNTYWALILPGLVSPWNMLILRNFFMAIPESLTEAATIDGADDLKILTHIILPLSLASLATIGLFYAVALWNGWFSNMLYVPKQNIVTLQYFLRMVMRTENKRVAETLEELLAIPSQQMQMATLVVTTLPIIIVYPMIQKYFVKGVMIGSVKG